MNEPPEVGSRWINSEWTNTDYFGPWEVTEVREVASNADGEILLRNVRDGRETDWHLCVWPGAWREEILELSH